jgi:hypothetical protein
MNPILQDYIGHDRTDRISLALGYIGCFVILFISIKIGWIPI